MTRYICVAVISLLALSCARFEEDAMPQQQLMQMRLAACVDTEEALTKTFLDGQPVVSVRNTYWLPDDAIGVTGNRNIARFDNICEDTTSVAFFDGQYESLDTYYAFYPYSEDASYSYQDTTIILDIPTVQKYQKNTFATDVVPMVAKFQLGDSLYFKNICGGFVVKMTGTEVVKNLRLTALNADETEAKIAGQFKVAMNSDKFAMNPTSNSMTSVSIDCGDGVQLNQSTPIAFHFILPPATYSGLKLVITTSEGERMIKSTAKPLNIRRSNLTYASSFEFNNTVEEVDLSYYGNSNCYVVSELGVYSFDATVIGNGAFGMLEPFNYHTDDVNINPKSVEVLWQDRENVISDVALKDGRVRFITDGVEGNALIAVKDAAGVILWSWHIWCTDAPKEHLYVSESGTYTVLDRNMGALRASRGVDNEWKESCGLQYQWGRKDPMSAANFSKNNEAVTTDEAIQNPTVFSSQWEWTDGFWNHNTKTLYDPCPVGYRVANADVYACLQKSGTFDRGWNFLYDGQNTTWYSVKANATSLGNAEYWSDSYMWTSTEKRYFYLNSGGMSVNSSSSASGQDPIRCMKDDMLYSVLVTLENASAVSATTAYVAANIVVQGKLEIDKSGYIIGTEPPASLEDGRIVYADAKTGDISKTIDGLSPLTKYYVRAFSLTTDGKVYYSSDVLYFITPNGSGTVNLNINGTANCYIVYPSSAKYCLDLVKGNSSESVGPVASAEILWETYNTLEDVIPGTVVKSVSIEGGHLVFEIPQDAKAGNALIAVKDAAGVILWSWHIWVTDFDPEATAQTYISGAVMMDRNLGALRSTPGDPSVYGMFYQWGRKDPLLGSYDGSNFISAYPADVKIYTDLEENRNVDYTIQNPSTVVKSLKNNSESWSWNKTIYDPCPVGWRVPDGYPGVWQGISSHTKQDSGFYLEEPYSTPAAYYPATGYTDGDGVLDYVGRTTYSWSVSLYNSDKSYALYMYNSDHSQKSRSNWCEHTVRCTKIDTSGKPGNGDDYVVDDEYEW